MNDIKELLISTGNLFKELPDKISLRFEIIDINALQLPQDLFDPGAGSSAPLLTDTFLPVIAIPDNNVLSGGVVIKPSASTQYYPAGTDRRDIPTFEKEIRFDKVWFKYPTGKDFVLQDVSFSVRKGEVIAIVGSSGAGKSTILDLLPRFYDLSRGAIYIDNKDTREINLFDLRDRFGIVSQETILFNDTVANNIRYGSKDATLVRIKAAAEAANAMEFIERMPQGFDTIIGEQGVMLSGGQRQRLSIARALLKNPPILIFDEATSALDTESERLVQSAIDNLIHNRTTFVVAHRLSTIRHANAIIVLEGGKIIEQGTHAELLALNKRYKYFYDIQFSTTV